MRGRLLVDRGQRAGIHRDIGFGGFAALDDQRDNGSDHRRLQAPLSRTRRRAMPPTIADAGLSLRLRPFAGGRHQADLPIERRARFDLVVNLKTAKSLGITIPDTILVRADEVIE
jgi:hypothetical protein